MTAFTRPRVAGPVGPDGRVDRPRGHRARRRSRGGRRGLRPAGSPGPPAEPVPFLRYPRVAASGPGIPWPRGRGCAGGPSGHAGDRPGPVRAGQRGGALVRAPGALDVEELDCEATALNVVRAGAGVMLALAHAVGTTFGAARSSGSPVDGTPVTGLWWATVPGDGRATAAARALQRFLTTPDATTALLARPARRMAAPTVRVELWS